MYNITVVIMTLELWYIFKDYIMKSVYLQCAEVVDIVVENTHAKNRERLLWQIFRYIEIIDLKTFCLMKIF